MQIPYNLTLSLQKESFIRDTAKTPFEMGGKTIDHLEKEKYLGDIIPEKECIESIRETLKGRRES